MKKESERGLTIPFEYIWWSLNCVCVFSAPLFCAGFLADFSCGVSELRPWRRVEIQNIMRWYAELWLGEMIIMGEGCISLIPNHVPNHVQYNPCLYSTSTHFVPHITYRSRAFLLIGVLVNDRKLHKYKGELCLSCWGQSVLLSVCASDNCSGRLCDSHTSHSSIRTHCPWLYNY